LGFWHFCVVAFPKTNYTKQTAICHTPPSVSAQALCFSVLDAVFGMTLEFGKLLVAWGHVGGGLCRLLAVGIIRV